jgi:hypothetical protein
VQRVRGGPLFGIQFYSELSLATVIHHHLSNTHIKNLRLTVLFLNNLEAKKLKQKSGYGYHPDLFSKSSVTPLKKVLKS